MRNEVGGALSDPSLEGGFDELAESNPTRRRNSAFSARNSAFSASSSVTRACSRVTVARTSSSDAAGIPRTYRITSHISPTTRRCPHRVLSSYNRAGTILALLAGFFLGLDFTAWNYSIFFVGSGIASVLLNLQIIILPALAIIFDGYKVARSYFVLVPIMLFGVILTGGVLDAPPSEGPATVYGVNIAVLGTILGCVSGTAYGLYLYASRKSSTLNPGTIVQPILYTCIGQLLAPIVWTFFSGRGLDFTNGVLVDGQLPLNPETTVGDPITLSNWIWIIVLATVGQALAWTFVQYGSVHMDTTIVAGLLLLSPILTIAAIAPVMFGEIPSALQILGVVIVLGAVAYQNRLPQALMRRMRGEKPPVTIE